MYTWEALRSAGPNTRSSQAPAAPWVRNQMEKSEINGENLKFARRAARAWRLRRQWHIGSSCNHLELLVLHHARLLARHGPNLRIFFGFLDLFLIF
jgi:hypothetical protein